MRGHRSKYSVKGQWQELSKPIQNESLFETIVRISTSALRSLSPYRFLQGRSWSQRWSPTDIYIFGWWLALLVVAFGVDAIRALWFSICTLVLCVARVLDVLSSQTGIILVDHKRHGHYFRSIERSVLLAFNNVGQMILCLGLSAAALAMLFPREFVFTTDCHNSQLGSCTGSTRPSSVIDFIYLTTGQMLTVGSKYSPVTRGAEIYATFTVLAGLFLIALTLAFFIGGITAARGARHDQE